MVSSGYNISLQDEYILKSCPVSPIGKYFPRMTDGQYIIHYICLCFKHTVVTVNFFFLLAGLDELANQTMKTALGKTLKGYQEMWEGNLKEVFFAHNSSCFLRYTLFVQ